MEKLLELELQVYMYILRGNKYMWPDSSLLLISDASSVSRYE